MLFIFGGVSDIEEEPKEFEFKMAMAGPVMSLALSAFFAMTWGYYAYAHIFVKRFFHNTANYDK